MRRYTSSELRTRLAEVLDAAERGESVVVERRGTRFSLRAERGTEVTRSRKRPLFEFVDPAVAAGQWTWVWSPGRLKFKSLLKRKRRP